MHLKTASSAAAALNLVQNDKESVNVVEFYTRTEDVLLPYLNSFYGSSIDASDYSIFTKLASKFEKGFFEDVWALNCLDPDILTRVTEYGPQIVEFVKKIWGK